MADEVTFEITENAANARFGLRDADDGPKKDYWDDPEVERGEGYAVSLDVDVHGRARGNCRRFGDCHAQRSDEEPLRSQDREKGCSSISCKLVRPLLADFKESAKFIFSEDFAVGVKLAWPVCNVIHRAHSAFPRTFRAS